ncbi:MAG: LruC domain-containing protein [Spirochaetaceae bacterium]
MRLTAQTLAAAVILVVIAACYNPLSTEQDGSDTDTTPQDQITTVERSSDGTFDFETVLDTEISFEIRGENADGGFDPVSGAIIRLETESGAPLYQARTDGQGSVSGLLSLAAAPGDVTVTVEAEGYAPRTVVVEDMVRYAEVSRVMYLEGDGMSAQASGDVDSDGDGVPDVYDAFPDDPDAAFAVDYPADGTYTVAFEDLYGRERAGDADYNDFVGQYSITEVTDAEGRITRIRGTAESVAKIAGYNHHFGLYFRFDGDARLSVAYNERAATHALEKMGGRRVADGADVVLFHSTHRSEGRTAEFILDFEDPQDPKGVTRAPYDPYLYVKNTGADVHLIGREPLPDSNNAEDDDFRDEDGFPWALLVPADWEHPDEGQRIEEAYPAFDYWRASEGEHYPDWYLMPGEDPGPPSEDPEEFPTVSYRGNDNEEGTVPVDDAEYEEGDEVEVLGNVGDLRKPGNGFTGWNTEADGSGETREVGSTFTMPAEEVTLYAQWKDDYAIGEEGPAGGWVFYDHGELHEDGWRFLEAAPSDISDGGVETFAWSNVTDASVGDTSTEIATGEANTAVIVAQDGHETSAAQQTIHYATERFGSSFGEWFLPSSGELELVYTELHSEAIGDFVDGDHYWSSSEQGSSFAEYRRFDTGASFGSRKSNLKHVRPVRAF